MRSHIKLRITGIFSLAIVLFSIPHPSWAQSNFPDPLIHSTQVHEGDLVLSGTEEMLLAHVHFIVSGNVIIKDRAKLILKQSILEFPGQFMMLDSAYVKADTSILGGANAREGIDIAEAEKMKGGILFADFQSRLEMNNCFSQTQFFMGNSTVRIKNSFLEQEPLGIVHVEGNTDVVIENSRIGALLLDIPDETPILIDSLRPGYLEDWSIHTEISKQIPYQLLLKRTHLASNYKGYRGGMELGWNISLDAEKSDVTISNSILNKIIIEFPQDEPAYFSDLQIREAINFDFNNIHVTNTEVQTQWGFVMNGGYAEFVNSEGLWISMMGGDADIIVHNSDVGEIDPFGYSGTLIFENTTWHSGYELWDKTHINIRGKVRMLPTVPIFDSTSQMTRFYDLFVLRDQDRAPYANMDLKLVKDGAEIWSGTTDNQGKVELSITFNHENSSDKWVLQTSDSTVLLNKTITIFDSNPLMINLEAMEDGIHSRNVMHVNNEAEGFPDGTLEHPYPGIQEAIDNAGGNLIHVHPGSYSGLAEPGSNNRTLTLLNHTSLLGKGPDSTFIVADVVAENASELSIQGFTLSGGVHSIASSVKLRNNIIRDSETAVWGTKSQLELINNTIVGNSSDAVFLHDSCSLLLRNNIIANNGGWGITGFENAVTIMDHNNIWNNGGNYFEFFEPGENDLAEDPLFENSSGLVFRLLAGSPCINRGHPDLVYNDPDGTRNDMGAFGGPGASDSGTSLPAFNSSYSMGKIFPNPVTGLVSLQLPGGDLPANITLHTIGGLKLTSFSTSVPLTEIEVSGYPPGIYMLSISTPSSTYTLKLLVY